MEQQISQTEKSVMSIKNDVKVSISIIVNDALKYRI